MRDYSNYHTSSLEKFNADATLEFERLLQVNVDAHDVLVDGTSKRLIIQNKYSSFQNDFKKIIGKVGDFRYGSILKHNSNDWLVTSIPESNSITETSTIFLCNKRLKWSSGGVTYDHPCTFRDVGKNLGVIGMDNSSYEKTGEYSLYCQHNTETGLIKQDQRLIFGRNAFKVVDVDDISYTVDDVGLLKITIEYDLNREGETDVPKDTSEFYLT